MNRPLRFVVIGLSGYSRTHLRAVQWLQERQVARLAAIVARPSDQKTNLDALSFWRSQGVRVFESVESFLTKAADLADVLTVPVGIHEHAPISMAALNSGLDIYCEKPIAGTVQEVDELIETRMRNQKKVVIGFQHIYSPAVQQLKARICDDRLGPVRSISLLHGWPRSVVYFRRSNWTGRLKCGKRWVLDSPANNAMAHYLLNALYLASAEPMRCAMPAEVRSELYRVNEIEASDLVQLRFRTEGGVQVFVLLAHCNAFDHGPMMHLTCENGSAFWQTDDGQTLVRYKTGKVERFDNEVNENWRFQGFADLVGAINDGVEAVCTPDFARPHTVLINAMHESCPTILSIPETFIHQVEAAATIPPYEKTVFRRLTDLDEEMRLSWQEQAFFSELSTPWAEGVQAEPFTIRNYESFPQHSKIQ